MFGFKKTYTDEKLVEQCKAGKHSAQQALYQKYSDKMFSICLRYTGNSADAEDVLVGGFMKIFDKIEQFSGEGSLEGWIRRIMVNESLMFIRKNKQNKYTEDLEVAEREEIAHKEDTSLEAEELLKLVQALPEGYRMVFNMYAIEGYSHKEIASELGISEGTSKSQLSKARKMLQQMLLEQERESDQYLYNRASLIALLILATTI